jgi:hypothetical protein
MKVSAGFLLSAGLAAFACMSGRDGVTLTRVEELRSIEALLPLAPDSIVRLYQHYTPELFYQEFTPRIEETRWLIDSMNRGIEPERRIDTLSIDHTFDNFGAAARTGRTLFLSSSYYFGYRDSSVVRAVVMHEFGHIHFERLGAGVRTRIANIWSALNARALLYLFRDGEYSGNARFGGHPEDSPEELFASAFNLFTNRREELEARFRFVEPTHLPLLSELETIVAASTRAGR